MEQSSKNTRMYIRWFLLRLALVVYDILAVNLAYFAALVIRFYVASEFNIWAVMYVPAFQKFAPFYTVCCLAVFGFFKLYNSRWKYAGLNDLNRIWMASLVTCVIQVAGTLLFVVRMPLSYYVLGAVMQLALIAGSRFSYRFFLVERSRIRKNRSKSTLKVMVVGVGETSRVVLKHLERDEANSAHPVCLVDFRGHEFGDMLEGIPVVSGIEKIPDAIRKYGVESVILADTIMPETTKRKIRETCRELDVEVQDFAGYFQDFRGAVSLRNLLEYTKGPVELVSAQKRQIFADGEEAMMSLTGKYVVSSISAKDSRLIVELQNDILVPNDVKEEWVRHHEENTGEDISFF